MRHRTIVLKALALAVAMGATTVASAPPELSANTKKSVVLIANYDKDGKLESWGTGFYVDEGIVITNKHVLEGAYYYRVFTLGENDTIDTKCSRLLSRSGIKINLDDDIAYMRAYVECPHSTVYFANSDPAIDAEIGILGFPYKGSLKESLELSYVTGNVLEGIDGTWMTTDAFLDFGNSGGPVLQGDRVVGVAVAKRVDEEGNYVTGLFVPISVVIQGLENANDANFGYTPQILQQNPVYQQPTPETDADCEALLGPGGELADNGGCRCTVGLRKNAAGTMCLTNRTSSSSVSSASQGSDALASSASSASHSRSSTSARSSQSSETPDARSLRSRVCERVRKWFSGNTKMLGRVNARLQKRFAFVCG